MRVHLPLRLRSRSPRSLVAVVCAVALAGLGLTSAVSAMATGSQSWVEDTNVAYGTSTCAVSGTDSVMTGDVYRPANPPAGPLPVVVYVHGGAFVGGSRNAQDNLNIVEELATLGYVVYNIDYCLANYSGGVAGYPTQVTDVEDAVTAVETAGFDNNNVDVGKVAIWGGSAGATLAIEAGEGLGTTSVAAVAGWSGAYDFRDLTNFVPQDITDAEAFLGCNPQLSSCYSQAQEASAALNVTSTTPPMVLWNSSSELVPLAQMQDMANSLATAGIKFAATEFGGDLHSNAYTHDAFCPTLDILSNILGAYTGQCVAPPDGSGAD